MAADRLRRAVHHDARSERERTLEQRGRDGVVDDAEDPALAGERAQRRQVRDPQQRVGGGFDPEHVRALACRDRRLRVGDVDQPDRCSSALLEGQQVGADVHVGHLGGDDRRLRAEQAHDRLRRRHPGRVGDGLSALERADRLLEHRPRRLTLHRARVSAAAQRGRRRDREVQRPTGDHGGPAGPDRDRLRAAARPSPDYPVRGQPRHAPLR